MRRLALLLAFLLGTTLAMPAFAQDDDAEEEEEPGAFAEYAATVGNRYMIGLNSLVTFPADPVMSTVSPMSEFDELPGGAVAKWPVGLVQGSMLAVYRAYTGVLDVVFAPLTPMRMLSPEPRYYVFDDAEHEWY